MIYRAQLLKHKGRNDMLNFPNMNQEQFLSEYWQKKPLLIPQAFTSFTPQIDADELAGLALEEDVESKIVLEYPDQNPAWHVKHGPFKAKDFKHLPKTHWTLLVQGVDRFVPEINHLLNAFDFLPQWRVDDVMISYACKHGSVGPHYDNYDVFLFQASGQRRWRLTTKACHQENTIPDLHLRIMAEFEVEEDMILSAGDMLYLPPHVGHHGVSLSDHCIGYSFGYRSYKTQELFESLCDYLAENKLARQLYQDPNWNELSNTAEIPKSAYRQAKAAMQNLLDDEQLLQQWFSRFATQLDEQAASLILPPMSAQEAGTEAKFIEKLKQATKITRDLNCRIAYHIYGHDLHLFINGYPFDYCEASSECVQLIACHRIISKEHISRFLEQSENYTFLFDLWRHQYINFDN